MLLQARLRKEELGMKLKLNDHDVCAHHTWIDKILRLVTKAGITKTTMYIKQVRHELPRPLRTKIVRVHTDWAVFAKAIREVDMGGLEQEMKERREEKEEHDKLTKLVGGASVSVGSQANLRWCSAFKMSYGILHISSRPWYGNRVRTSTSVRMSLTQHTRLPISLESENLVMHSPMSLESDLNPFQLNTFVSERRIRHLMRKAVLATLHITTQAIKW
jgi:hypothetical protein